jgi:hypothetical protein
VFVVLLSGVGTLSNDDVRDDEPTAADDDFNAVVVVFAVAAC